MKVLIISVLVALIALSANAGEDGKCRALILSGGGDKGSYQASVLTYLIEHLDPIEVTWDVISGVSVGSLNGATLATFKQGDENEFKDLVTDVWSSVKFENVFRLWDEGIEYTIKEAPAIVDPTPLTELIAEKIGYRTMERHFIAGTCDANTGTFQIYEYPADHQPMSEHL